MARIPTVGAAPNSPEAWQLWVGATVDLTITLATSTLAELVIHSMVVYPDGWAMTLDVGVDRFALVDPMDPADIAGDHHVAAGPLRFGLKFADGSRALPARPGSPLEWLGGSAHDDRYWIGRSPTPDAIDLVFEYPSANIPRGVHRLDGRLLFDASKRCTPLWSNRRR